MKGSLFFLGFAVLSVSAFDAGLRVRFNIGVDIGESFFYDIPRNRSQAILANYTSTERAEGPHPNLTLYCQTDRTVCPFFDDNGYVAGLQVAFAQDEFTDSVLDWTIQGFVEWAPSTSNGTIKSYWAKQQYFVDEEYLALNPEYRASIYNTSKTLQLDAVWLSGINGQLDKVSTALSDIESSIYTKQSCIPWMGRHFFYNMTEETLCENDKLYPWFLVVSDSYGIGSGMLTYGKLPEKTEGKDWFERPPRLAVKVIAPTAPECLLDLVSNYGLVTIHIYYIDKPWWLLDCIFN